MAAMSLAKGNRVSLDKQGIGVNLTNVMVGLGWDINQYQGSADFDLDVVLFEVGPNGKVIDDGHFVYYNQLTDPENAVTHSGDNRTGEGEGDDESCNIDFTKVNANVSKIVIAVTIYAAKANNQNFGQVDNAYVRLVNNDTGQEVLRYDLSEDYCVQTSLVFAEIYRKADKWVFKAVGEGYEKELIDLCLEYGVNVQ